MAALTPPDPPLAAAGLRLEPLAQRHTAAAFAMFDDADIRRFTRIPADADETYISDWIGRYERGWEDGTCAGFAICDGGSGELIGFAGLVALNLAAAEAEIGYAVARQGRGRGVATAVVGLLTEWGFTSLALERLELRIDVENARSVKVAERSGYQLEGVRRSSYVKAGRRAETGVWSRLPSDKLAV